MKISKECSTDDIVYLHIKYSLYLDTLQNFWCRILTPLVADYSRKTFYHNQLSCLSYTGKVQDTWYRGNPERVRFAIACQNESYEVILNTIWCKVMILNFKFKINSVKKLRETMGRKLFMESHLRFSLWNITFGILSWIP